MTYWRHVRWGVEIGGARAFVIVILMHITFAVHSRLHRNSTDLKDHAKMISKGAAVDKRVYQLHDVAIVSGEVLSIFLR